MTLKGLKRWWEYEDRPLMISGPCSAESPEQLRESIFPIASQVDYIRAGIWKPRTRPGNFEGHGENALKWISELKKEKPFKFATEVGTPEHVDIAMKYDVDLFWIGARTTVNPFLVNEIASALKGSKKPVLVKNPIHPEYALWKGAIERMLSNDIIHLGAIHRGFHSYEKSKFRNIPLWQIPLDLKSEFPELPLICDPSHIGGDSHMIAGLAQKAMDLAFDGLMIETHCNPKEALSDAKQQITPKAFLHLTEHLQFREQKFSEKSFADQLDIIRDEIDAADLEMMQAIAKRLRLVEHIGEIKKESNVAIFQISRWKEIFKSRLDMAKELNMEDQFTVELLRLLHQQSVKKQTEIFEKQSTKTNE